MNNISVKIVQAVIIVITVFVIGLLIGFPLMWLWNYVMPALGLPELDYWKIMALYFLARALVVPIHTSIK